MISKCRFTPELPNISPKLPLSAVIKWWYVSSSSEREEVQALNRGPGLIYDGIILDAPNITEQQVLHHGSGKPVLVIGDCESFVNINSMDTACARGCVAIA